MINDYLCKIGGSVYFYKRRMADDLSTIGIPAIN
jgi:hypothetical protein